MSEKLQSIKKSFLSGKLTTFQVLTSLRKIMSPADASVLVRDWALERIIAPEARNSDVR